MKSGTNSQILIKPSQKTSLSSRTESVLQNFNESDLRLDPFPHIVMKNCLSSDYTEALHKNFPDKDQFLNGKNPGSNLRFDVMETNENVAPEWREFCAYHRSPEFFFELVSKFGAALKNSQPRLVEKFGDFRNARFSTLSGDYKEALKNGEIDIALSATISMNSPVLHKNTTVRSPHVDNPNKIFGGLIYFRHPDDKSTGGALQLYRFKKGRRSYAGTAATARCIEVVDTIPYEQNNLVIFLNSCDSIHGVTTRSKTEYIRRFMYFSGTSNIPAHDVSDWQESTFDKYYRKIRGRLLGYHYSSFD